MTHGRSTSSFAPLLLAGLCEEYEVLTGRVVRGEISRAEEIPRVVGKSMWTYGAKVSCRIL